VNPFGTLAPLLVALGTLCLVACTRTSPLDAIDAKDPQRLFDVGGEIDEACEACHLVYWYPPSATAQN
jgi:hypothetical protein